jgi:putative Holliday junction resolvase
MENTSEPNSSSNDLSSSEFPTEGALLGIDFGTKRLGFAVCDRAQTIASPVENYQRQSEQVDRRALLRLIEDYRIVGLVVGYPVHMSGDESESAMAAREFGNWAAEQSQLPMMFWDERFSSLSADYSLQFSTLSDKKKKAKRDMLAARAILQKFLDAEDRDEKPADLRKGN